MRVLFLLGILSMALSSVVHAEFTLEQYRKFDQYPTIEEKMHSYINGVGTGIFWANVGLGFQGKERLFCPPGNLAMSKRIILSIFDQELRNPYQGKDYKSDIPIEVILLNAFMSSFPCGNGS